MAANAYEHAPKGHGFTYLLDVSIELGGEILHALDLKIKAVDELETDAMERGHAARVHAYREIGTKLRLQRDLIEEAMNEACLEFVPTAREHNESVAEDLARWGGSEEAA